LNTTNGGPEAASTRNKILIMMITLRIKKRAILFEGAEEDSLIGHVRDAG
jgi:hypothetical protein